MLLAIAASWLAAAAAQKAGTRNPEQHPPLAISRCTLQGGCQVEQLSITLDANWRYVHGASTTSGTTHCFSEGGWNAVLCSDPVTCAENCAVEGVTQQMYASTYGVTATAAGVQLKYVNVAAGGRSVGSRVYVMAGDATYKMFLLKNREFSFDVDTSALPCGLNGAVYFVEMSVDGNMIGGNTAGAKYGTGYCDAQCPRDLQFINGEANLLEWSNITQSGHFGHCCTEMDIWEANSKGAAYTPHPCTCTGALRCEGALCGETSNGQRYQGTCDKDGCDFNSYRLGDHAFFGPGGAVDPTRPLTVVTQFITADGTDAGSLSEIRRSYMQDGKVIKNSVAQVPGITGNSVTDAFCSAQKAAFGDQNDFAAKGGMRKMGEALDRGMVLVLSLWDDRKTNMRWLDSNQRTQTRLAGAGVLRGPCPMNAGSPHQDRALFPDATVSFSNIKYGEIGSTTGNPQRIGGMVTGPAAAVPPGVATPTTVPGAAPMATPWAGPVATPWADPTAGLAAAPMAGPAPGPRYYNVIGQTASFRQGPVGERSEAGKGWNPTFPTGSTFCASATIVATVITLLLLHAVLRRGARSRSATAAVAAAAPVTPGGSYAQLLAAPPASAELEAAA